MIVAKALVMAHELLRPRLQGARTVVDATAGNGHDTLFLAANTPPDAVVWAFDIQAAALEKTAVRLAGQGLAGKCRLVADSHANLADHVAEPIDAAMFNLGYLPGGDHACTTRAATTTDALGQVLDKLTTGGLATVVAYPGFAAGAAEEEALAAFLAALPQTSYTVANWRVLNQRNNPPVLYIVEKIGSDPE